MIWIGLAATLISFGFRPVVNARMRLAAAVAQRSGLEEDVPRLELENRQLELSLAAQKTELAKKYNLPADPNKPVLDLISALLPRHNLSLVNFREESLTLPGSIQVEIQCLGGYREIVSLLQDLRILERPAHILTFQISANSENGESCLARLRVEFAHLTTLKAASFSPYKVFH